MTSESSLFRSLVIYGICLPLAIFLGYMLANPLDLQSFSTIGLVLLLLVSPLLLRWHHAWLIATWNSTLVIYFLPGAPPAWAILVCASLLIASLRYILDRRQKFLSVPGMTWPLVFLALVVIITAQATGGMGMRIMGGNTYGGKRYLMLLMGIAGYFALASERIPPGRAPFFVAVFFFGYVTIAIGELGHVLGAWARPFLMFFPQAGSDLARPPGVTEVVRLIFLAPAGTGLACILLGRHGIRGIFSLGHPVRLAAFLLCMFVSMLGGYRSWMFLLLLIFVLVFYLEGLVRSPLLPIFMLAAILASAILAPLVLYLPHSLQRSLSFLPVPVVDDVRRSAQDSTQWRLMMWKHIWENLEADVPKHLLLGTGYGFSGREMILMRDRPRGGDLTTEGFELASEYHNGPLSIILPFGIWGAIGYLWFLAAALRILHRNYRYGDPDLRRLNTILLAYFLGKTVLFLVVAGGFYNDFFLMTGVVGMSVSVNGGMAQPALAPAPEFLRRRMVPPRPAYKPAGA